MKPFSMIEPAGNAYNMKDAIKYIKAHTSELLTPTKHGYICDFCKSGTHDSKTGMTISDNGFIHCWVPGCEWNNFRPKLDKNEIPEPNTGGGTILDYVAFKRMIADGFKADEINAMSDAEYKYISRKYLIDAVNECAERLHIEIDDAAPDRDDIPQPQKKAPGALKDYTEFYKACRENLYKSKAALTYLQNKRKLEIDPDEIDEYNDNRDPFYLGFCAGWVSPAADDPDARTGSDVIIIPVSKNYYITRSIYGSAKIVEKGNGNISLWHAHGTTAPGTAPSFEPFSFTGKHIVYVCESAIDAMTVYQLGGESVALNSTNNYALYYNALTEYGKKDVITVLCLDNDDAGKSASSTLYTMIKAAGFSVYAANISGKYKDVNDAYQAESDAVTARFTALNAILNEHVMIGEYFPPERTLAAEMAEYGDILTMHEPAAASKYAAADIAEIKAQIIDELPPDAMRPSDEQLTQMAISQLDELNGLKTARDDAFDKYQAGTLTSDDIAELTLNFGYDPDAETLAEFFAFYGYAADDPDEQPAEQLNDSKTLTPADHFANFKELINTDTFKPIPTGFNALDRLLNGGLTRGQLVLLLGAPGVGKTTLTHQLLETAAKRGHNVVYFNLEMSREQLLAKSISRITAEQGKCPLEATDVLRAYSLNAEQQAALNDALAEYEKTYLPRIAINFYDTEQDLTRIAKHLKAIGDKAQADGEPAPIVALDYLQYGTLPNTDDAATIAKYALNVLKNYAVDYNTVAFAISAVNRDSAKNGIISLYSARDTSATEYTADVQIALNFTAFQTGRTKTADNKTTSYLMRQTPRHVCMQLLKARFAIPGYVTYLDYDPAHDLFKCIDRPTKQYYAALDAESQNADNATIDGNASQPAAPADKTAEQIMQELAAR